MLNIISRSIVSTHTRGPRKVVMNALKGLDVLEIPYVVNHALDAADLLWIHDDPAALEQIHTLPDRIRVIAGPNIYTVPKELPSQLPLDRFIFIHPALWVQRFWEMSGGDHLRNTVWPVGIDTATFCPTDTPKDIVLVYNKMRPYSDVMTVTNTLKTADEKYETLTYGTYEENQYQELLARAKAIIWIGRSESQGIALLEAMAMNVPVLVWDITHFGQWEGTGKERFTTAQLAYREATATPYFDESCGIRFTQEEELEEKLAVFLSSLTNYQPRQYVLENLSLTKQAAALLQIFTSEFGVTENTLRDTSLHNKKLWRNASLSFRVFSKIKSALRRVLR